ncbi:hypothetical protein EDEG_02067 [Edhazardia aedis USNM 41457]|uniref:DH domain-containing protein n=1 Tax=Edhazardia aedis (strain USNM 41457) TaxID=1003232 RepID=J9D7X6_EDHAE|nr:hypothetical protein EDEG_02067 [Edhazardia aedis USNM 41457]|eukprot:EJW03599.1 hypothetical protein EDEG_02067 [Edhazardia aedis USNM 41457]
MKKSILHLILIFYAEFLHSAGFSEGNINNTKELIETNKNEIKEFNNISSQDLSYVNVFFSTVPSKDDHNGMNVCNLETYQTIYGMENLNSEISVIESGSENQFFGYEFVSARTVEITENGPQDIFSTFGTLYNPIIEGVQNISEFEQENTIECENQTSDYQNAEIITYPFESYIFPVFDNKKSQNNQLAIPINTHDESYYKFGNNEGSFKVLNNSEIANLDMAHLNGPNCYLNISDTHQFPENESNNTFTNLSTNNVSYNNHTNTSNDDLLKHQENNIFAMVEADQHVRNFFELGLNDSKTKKDVSIIEKEPETDLCTIPNYSNFSEINTQNESNLALTFTDKPASSASSFDLKNKFSTSGSNFQKFDAVMNNVETADISICASPNKTVPRRKSAKNVYSNKTKNLKRDIFSKNPEIRQKPSKYNRYKKLKITDEKNDCLEQKSQIFQEPETINGGNMLKKQAVCINSNIPTVLSSNFNHNSEHSPSTGKQESLFSIDNCNEKSIIRNSEDVISKYQKIVNIFFMNFFDWNLASNKEVALLLNSENIDSKLNNYIVETVYFFNAQYTEVIKKVEKIASTLQNDVYDEILKNELLIEYFHDLFFIWNIQDKTTYLRREYILVCCLRHDFANVLELLDFQYKHIKVKKNNSACNHTTCKTEKNEEAKILALKQELREKHATRLNQFAKNFVSIFQKFVDEYKILLNKLKYSSSYINSEKNVFYNLLLLNKNCLIDYEKKIFLNEISDIICCIPIPEEYENNIYYYSEYMSELDKIQNSHRSRNSNAILAQNIIFSGRLQNEIFFPLIQTLYNLKNFPTITNKSSSNVSEGLTEHIRKFNGNKSILHSNMHENITNDMDPHEIVICGLNQLRTLMKNKLICNFTDKNINSILHKYLLLSTKKKIKIKIIECESTQLAVLLKKRFLETFIYYKSLMLLADF